MIFNRKRIALQYLRTGFFLDAISSIPWDLMVATLMSSSTAVLRIVRVHTFCVLTVVQGFKYRRQAAVCTCASDVPTGVVRSFLTKKVTESLQAVCQSFAVHRSEFLNWSSWQSFCALCESQSSWKHLRRDLLWTTAYCRLYSTS